MLSAMAAVQDDKVHVVNLKTGRLAAHSAEHWHRTGLPLLRSPMRERFVCRFGWNRCGPMCFRWCCPRHRDGLGVLLLNSNAEAHFSFTNALGLVSAEQWWAMSSIVRQFPRAHWIVALHHHMVEYPNPAKVFSDRIGTALINGTWFVRQLQSIGSRMVVMHGHRHIDWIGDCGGVRIVSAPSPVMEATNDEPTCFYIHTLAAGPEAAVLAGA